MSEKTTYRHTPDMGEISGFGGGYEGCCQDMLEAGVRWVLEHLDETPEFKGFENVYGILMEDNSAAKALTEAIIAAAKGEATGAMHQAVTMRCLAVKKLGWDEYCRQCREHETKEVAADE